MLIINKFKIICHIYKKNICFFLWVLFCITFFLFSYYIQYNFNNNNNDDMLTIILILFLFQLVNFKNSSLISIFINMYLFFYFSPSLGYGDPTPPYLSPYQQQLPNSLTFKHPTPNPTGLFNTSKITYASLQPKVINLIHDSLLAEIETNNTQFLLCL